MVVLALMAGWAVEGQLGRGRRRGPGQVRPCMIPWDREEGNQSPCGRSAWIGSLDNYCVIRIVVVM